MRWLSFRIFNAAAEKAGKRFAIRESQAVESVPFSGVMPDGPRHDAILGTLEFHGRPIKVYDLGVALGLGACDLPHRVRVLVARHTRLAIPIGIAVQPELAEVASVDDPNVQVLDLRALGRIGKAGT